MYRPGQFPYYQVPDSRDVIPKVIIVCANGSYYKAREVRCWHSQIILIILIIIIIIIIIMSHSVMAIMGSRMPFLMVP